MVFSRKTFMRVACAAAIALSTTGASFAQEVSLTLHQFLPRQSTAPRLVLDKWIENVERESEGRISVDHFPSMQLGGRPPELIDQAIDGVADIVWTVVGYTPGRFPSTEVFELPFMVEDVGAASSAFWQMFETHMADTEFKDLKVLGTWVHGPGVIHTNTLVTTPEDMQGLKIRGGSRLVNALLEKTGATPVGMPAPAIPEGLSKGVIDGTTLPWEVTESLKVPELVDKHTEFEGASLYTLTFVMAMNKARYDSLPEDLKRIIDNQSGLAFSVFAGRTQSGQDAHARELAAEMGNEIKTLSGDELTAWQTAAQPVYDDWVAEMESIGIDGQALIDEARALMSDFEN